MTQDFIKRTLLDPNSHLVRVVEDRQHVYKLYYRLSRKRELKLVVDFLAHKKLNIRTVKVLNRHTRLAFVRRRRF